MKEKFELAPPTEIEPTKKTPHLENHARLMLETNLSPNLKEKIPPEDMRRLTKILVEAVIGWKEKAA